MDSATPVDEIMSIVSEPETVETEPAVRSSLRIADHNVAVPSTKQIEAHSDLWLQHVPRRQWHPDLSRMLFFNAGRQNGGVEEFRRLRSRLYRIREEMKLNTIAVSSGVPGEGKSFVAANLAQALASDHERRVLLMDGDLRKSDLNVHLGAERGPGITDYLSGRVGVRDIVQRGQMDSLYFIAAGSAVPNCAELTAGGGFAKLIEEVHDSFDWIVVDTPPVVPISDAVMITGACDAVLLVVCSGVTKCDVAQKARQEFRDLPLIGVVLNRVPDGATYSSSASYGYDRYYGQAADQGQDSRKTK